MTGVPARRRCLGRLAPMAASVKQAAASHCTSDFGISAGSDQSPYRLVIGDKTDLEPGEVAQLHRLCLQRGPPFSSHPNSASARLSPLTHDPLHRYTFN